MKNLNQFLVCLFLSLLSVVGQAQQNTPYFVKHLQFSGNESLEQRLLWRHV